MNAQDGYERRRVALCVAPGVVAAAVVSWLVLWQLGLLIGWTVTVVSLLLWIGSEIAPLDAAETALVATREDGSRNAARVTVLRHALLSYVFGAAIIASTINVLAGLVG